MRRNVLAILGICVFLASVVYAQENITVKTEGILPAEIPKALELCESYVDLIKKGVYQEALDQYNFYSPGIDEVMKSKIQNEFIANMGNFIKKNGEVQSFQFDHYGLSNMTNLSDGGMQPLMITVNYIGIFKDNQSSVLFKVIKIDNVLKILSFEMKMNEKS